MNRHAGLHLQSVRRAADGLWNGRHTPPRSRVDHIARVEESAAEFSNAESALDNRLSTIERMPLDTNVQVRRLG